MGKIKINEVCTGYNPGFTSGGVTCKLGVLCFYSSSVLVDSIVLLNPPTSPSPKPSGCEKL